MASVEKRTRGGRVRWYARYRDPAGQQHTRTFDRRTDAETFVLTTESTKLLGGYVDPKQAARTFQDVAEQHRRSYEHTLAADSTRPRKRSTLDKHILPALGDYPIGEIKPSTVAAAVAIWTKTLAPGTTGRCSVRSARSSTRRLRTESSARTLRDPKQCAHLRHRADVTCT